MDLTNENVEYPGHHIRFPVQPSRWVTTIRFGIQHLTNPLGEGRDCRGFCQECRTGFKGAVIRDGFGCVARRGQAPLPRGDCSATD